jgi:hypothetical protein
MGTFIEEGKTLVAVKFENQHEYEEHFIDYAMGEIWSALDDEEPMTQNRVKVESGTQRIKQEPTRDMGWSGKQATSENTLSSHPERLQRPKGRKREREARTQPDSTDSSTRNVSERERDMGRSGKQVTGENTSSYHPGGLLRPKGRKGKREASYQRDHTDLRTREHSTSEREAIYLLNKMDSSKRRSVMEKYGPDERETKTGLVVTADLGGPHMHPDRVAMTNLEGRRGRRSDDSSNKSRRHWESSRSRDSPREYSRSTVPCRYYERGNCVRGDYCSFSHYGYDRSQKSRRLY